MPRISGEPYDSARELFQANLHPGTPRCQAFGRTKMVKWRKTVRGLLGDGKYIDPQTWASLDNQTKQTIIADVAACQCNMPVRPGFRVCLHHGAGRKGGPTGGKPPSVGIYSKVLPTRLLAKFETARGDPGLLELKEEVAVVTAMIAETFEQLGENPPDLEEMGDAILSMGQALQVGDVTIAQDEFLRLTETFNSSRGQWAVYDQVTKLIEQKRRLSLAHYRQLEVLGNILTAQQALALMAALVRAVNIGVDGGLQVVIDHVKTEHDITLPAALIDEAGNFIRGTAAAEIQGLADSPRPKALLPTGD